jgi:ABC-type transporter Mla subunit MlaD
MRRDGRSEWGAVRSAFARVLSVRARVASAFAENGSKFRHDISEEAEVGQVLEDERSTLREVVTVFGA